MQDTCRIAIVGKGALGLLFASLADAALGPGAAVFVMDDERYERHACDEYTVNGSPAGFCTARLSQAPAADLVMLAVKSTGLAGALDTLAALPDNGAPVVSVMNGISSERRIAERLGWERVVPCVALGMDAARYGSSLEYSKPGRLLLGAFPQTSAAMCDRAFEVLSSCGIEAHVEDDILHRLWSKFMLNVGVNQVTCAYGLDYAHLFADEGADAFRTYVGAMREVMAVAHAEGVELTEDDLNSSVRIVRTLDPSSRPSMAQDRLNGNPTEVEEFAGEVVRLAEKHGILVPCNRFLYGAIKAIEAAY